MPLSARDYALRLLTIRPRSVREMLDRLARKGYGKPEIEAAIVDLADLGLLDDRKFAVQWVESRIELKPMGQARLRAELTAKGVDREIIDQTLSQNKVDYDEKSAALALAQKKLKTLKGLEPEVTRRRLAGFLSRRGFSTEMVAMAIKSFPIGKKETRR